MALQKPIYNFRGVNIESAYIRVSQIGYRNDGKTVYFWLNLYANQEEAEQDNIIEEFFCDSMPLSIGDTVPDVLAQIYLHIKTKVNEGDERYSVFKDCTDV